MDKMEARDKFLTKKESGEAPVKEAMFAMEESNALSLYDCLVPEIDAYRPLRLPLSKENKETNFVAKYRLYELK